MNCGRGLALPETDDAAMEAAIRRIEQYLIGRGHTITEGSASAREMQFLAEYARTHSAISRVFEIGFNAGLSATALLMARDDISVVSFDICDHPYASDAQRLADTTFPGRHTLVRGDSTVTLPNYARTHGNDICDFLFVDGGHDLATARADLENGALVSGPSTVVMIDDLTPWEPWGIGPTAAWRQMCDNGNIVQDSLYRNGQSLPDITGERGDRVWALGHYRTLPLQSA